MYEITYSIPAKLEDEYSEKLISAGITSFCFEKISGNMLLKIYSDSPEPFAGIEINFFGMFQRSMIQTGKINGPRITPGMN